MRFATRLLLVQLATVAAVVAVCALVFGWLGVRQLRAESEAAALNIARTVAEDSDVKSLVTEFSADPGTPDAADLRDGPLQQIATDVADRTDALFVVITDDHGIRLAHPNQDLLGQVVSTPFAEVLEGNEVVDWEVGTLGESARAKVPIYADAGGAPAGEVSVGFERASVFDDLPALLTTIAVAALGGVALATLATLLLRRRFERLTLGLQPEELVALVQNQAAVLEGVGDGVVALDPDGVVRVCNEAAERMLGLDDPVGRRFDELALPEDVLRAVREGATAVEAVVGDRVLYLDTRPVRRDARALGEIVVVRDRTDVEALAGRLETVRAMTEALRVQRHEFANRLHVASGLIDADRVDEARAFLGDLTERGAVDFAVAGLERVPDAFLQSLLGATGAAARERGVSVRVSDDTLLLSEVALPEDVAAILGNLVGNAVTAAVAGDEPRWVEVALLGDGDELVVTVADSGRGIRPVGSDPFGRAGSRSADSGHGDAVHGHGFGLPLSRDLARRHGGDVWLIDAGGLGSGAVFGARLPGALRIDAAVPREENA
ncbi:two-component system CitB family sensor kinase [Microbacterium trichothecenolyticum]|uniref:sensor histidine kinase n=1 Tax=Microbacterium trichothecenolyticum TaxID=69370 RepID=UPI0028613BA7|nr:sensor histidine kinase [Microbacterium trichothecenolyticum]MDR7186707.1 two-component system CitB family sensor kinase [Microbacterium trichothecenolyticum]